MMLSHIAATAKHFIVWTMLEIIKKIFFHFCFMNHTLFRNTESFSKHRNAIAESRNENKSLYSTYYESVLVKVNLFCSVLFQMINFCYSLFLMVLVTISHLLSKPMGCFVYFYAVLITQVSNGTELYVRKNKMKYKTQKHHLECYMSQFKKPSWVIIVRGLDRIQE